MLIQRNRSFLIGQEVDPRVRSEVIAALLELPEVTRITYLRLEIIGPKMVTVVGDVDLSGDDTESHVAVRLRALEAKISASPVVVGAVLSLSSPDEESLVPEAGTSGDHGRPHFLSKAAASSSGWVSSDMWPPDSIVGVRPIRAANSVPGRARAWSSSLSRYRAGIPAVVTPGRSRRR